MKLKYKHAVSLVALILLFFGAIISAIITQDGNGIAGFIIIIYCICVIIIASVALVKQLAFLAKHIIQNWNNELPNQ